MSSSKRIEDFDEDIVSYNADSDDDISKVSQDERSNDSELEDQFRRRPAPDLGIADGYDSAQPQQGTEYVLRCHSASLLLEIDQTIKTYMYIV